MLVVLNILESYSYDLTIYYLYENHNRSKSIIGDATTFIGNGKDMGHLEQRYIDITRRLSSLDNYVGSKYHK